jgi:hypothetical protein
MKIPRGSPWLQEARHRGVMGACVGGGARTGGESRRRGADNGARAPPSSPFHVLASGPRVGGEGISMVAGG